jgi:hypothetical protein
LCPIIIKINSISFLLHLRIKFLKSWWLLQVLPSSLHLRLHLISVVGLWWLASTTTAIADDALNTNGYNGSLVLIGRWVREATSTLDIGIRLLSDFSSSNRAVVLIVGFFICFNDNVGDGTTEILVLLVTWAT